MRKTEYTENGGFLQRDSVEHEEYAEAYSTENQEIRERDGANLLEKVLDRNNLNKAYKRVKANKGASGVDGMRDCGDHHFEYSIKAYEKGFDKNNAVLDGVAYNAQFQVVNGELNIESLPTLICDDARISSIKMSQDKKGIIRINEYHGKDTKGTLIIS